MTTKIITPADVTPEILRAGIESNETAKNKPSRFQLGGGGVHYHVKWEDKWEWVDTIAFASVQDFMEADSTDETIWTTTVEQETPHD
jgi:hypothetical protein